VLRVGPQAALPRSVREMKVSRMITRELSPSEASGAAAIQAAIDDMAATGGVLVLPEMDLTVDRGIELRSGVEIRGRGDKTVLRKGPGRVYPLTGYHNYGMCDAPVKSPAGLEVGMTVSIHDNLRRGFYETFARIAWLDGEWVGLDHGIEADYSADEEPRLTTAYPLIFGHGIEHAAVRDLCLDGRRDDQECAMGGCRGGAVYFAKSRDVAVANVALRDYHGEGIGFQMCRDVRIRSCRVAGCSGNGIHPGAGSTNCLIEDCASEDNEKSGFYFCVRANHITVSRCVFEANGNGVSMGTRDCRNVVDACRIAGNRGPGILVRKAPSPCDAHSCLIRNCAIEGNCAEEGEGQIEIAEGAHDLIFRLNRIASSPERKGPGLAIAPGARRVHLDENSFSNCAPSAQADEASLTGTPPDIECGYGTAPETAYRHLAAYPG